MKFYELKDGQYFIYKQSILSRDSYNPPLDVHLYQKEGRKILQISSTKTYSISEHEDLEVVPIIL